MSSFSTYHRLTEVYQKAMELPFDQTSKIVLISDCHRGDGSWVDDFSHNQSLYYCAIKYYYRNGFTYIDLGDSDELWKNRHFSGICTIYADIFELLHQFYSENRYYMIYGNHDIVKRYPAFRKHNLDRYYNTNTDTFEGLFENAEIHEGLILKDTDNQAKLFLVHGHQGDIVSDIFWRVGRFLSRYIWRRLEFFGLKDPTSAAKNYDKKKKVERKIINWAADRHQIVIAGHTHRPTCPDEDEVPYFNTGSCIHPDCITCIEIVHSEISLMKWGLKTKNDGSVFVDRELIAAPRKIQGQ
ncbi:serine/threonine protein phosphatase [Clostridium sp. W14A]|nr:serine/threonine protein phosphatase [Clostridium sp. W14A]